MKKLLIIDDDEMMLSALSYFFRGEDYKVVTSPDGFQGIELFQKHKPDVVLVDLSMPSIHGLEVLDRIKNLDRDAKIVIITGYASSEVMQLSIDKGAFAFYDKTMDVEILREQVEKAVEAPKVRPRVPFAASSVSKEVK